MPSPAGPKTSDWASRLGVRDMIPPQRRTYHDICPQVDKMKHDIKEIVATYYTMSIEDIKDSHSLRQDTNALFERYGGTIWSDQDNRVWLLDPDSDEINQWPQGWRYDRHRFFYNVADHQFIGTTLYGYVLSRVLRHHKDNYRKSINGLGSLRLASETPSLANLDPDDRYTPNLRIKPSASRADNSSLRCCCFGNALDGRSGADILVQQDVWFGDYNDKHRPVNGASRVEIEKSYLEVTQDGFECNGAEPFVLYESPARGANPSMETVVCAACKSGSNAPMHFLEVDEYRWNNTEFPDEECHMHSWILRCELKGREVYAFVKELPRRKREGFGPECKLWAFWKVDGGYTSKILLVSARPDANMNMNILESGLSNDGKRKRKRSTTGQSGDEPDTCSSRTKTARTTDENPHATSASLLINAFQPINATRQPIDAGVALVADRRPSFDSLYDATPEPRRGNVNPNGDQASIPLTPLRSPDRTPSSLTVSDDRPQHSDQENSPMLPPGRSTFKVWFTFEHRGENYQKLIAFDTSMSFLDALSHTKTKLGRYIQGTELVELAIKFKGDEFEGQPAFLIDDDDMWNEMLKLVKKTGSNEITGKLGL